MPLRTRLFVIIAVIVIAVGGLAFFLSKRSNKPVDQVVTIDQSGQSGTGDTNVVNNVIPSTGGSVAPTELSKNVTIKPLNPTEIQQNAAKQVAKIVIERYNSFSTENNYQNIRDVEDLVTADLWKVISQMMSKPQNGPFIGVTTVVINATQTSWTDNEASYKLKTHRTTEKDGVKTDQYQDINVKVVKQGNTWLVDDFKVVATK